MDTPWWKKPWAIISAVVGALIAAIFYQKRRADNAESEVEAGKAREKDAALAERERQLNSEADAERRKLDGLKKEEPKADELDPEKVKKYWENQ